MCGSGVWTLRRDDGRPVTEVLVVVAEAGPVTSVLPTTDELLLVDTVRTHVTGSSGPGVRYVVESPVHPRPAVTDVG